MLGTYLMAGQELDSLDLKASVVTQGVKVSGAVYRRFCRTHRLHPDPRACNCMILPDRTTVLLTDMALHLRYLKTAIVLEALRNIRQVARLKTPFTLDVSLDGRPVLSHNGAPVTEVAFPPASRFYEQRTTSGLPFLGNAAVAGQ